MPALLEFFAPIKDADLPHLLRHKQRGVFALSVCAALLAPSALVNVVVDLVRGLAVPSHGAATVAGNLVLFGLVGVVARRSWGKQHPDVLVFIEGVLLLLDLALAGWVSRDGSNDVLVYMTIVPLLLAVSAPWRPIFSLALSAPAVGTLITARALGAPLTESVPAMVYSCISLSIVGAAANQIQRRLWLQLERTRAQLVASERMSALGRMTAGVAHELKTPLAAAMNSAENVRDLSVELRDSIGHADVTADDLRAISGELGASAELLGAGLRRAAQFVAAMRDQTLDMNTTTCEPFRIADAVAGVLTLMAHTIRQAGVVVDTRGVDPALVAEGDAGKFAQIVTNLVSNALDACATAGPGKAITLAAGAAADGSIVVVVEDDGPGVPEPIRERVFDALFTTKAKTNGTGLGLAISRDLAEGALEGSLKLAPSARGARFELVFPGKGARRVHSQAWAPAVS